MSSATCHAARVSPCTTRWVRLPQVRTAQASETSGLVWCCLGPLSPRRSQRQRHKNRLHSAGPGRSAATKQLWRCFWLGASLVSSSTSPERAPHQNNGSWHTSGLRRSTRTDHPAPTLPHTCSCSRIPPPPRPRPGWPWRDVVNLRSWRKATLHSVRRSGQRAAV